MIKFLKSFKLENCSNEQFSNLNKFRIWTTFEFSKKKSNYSLFNFENCSNLKKSNLKKFQTKKLFKLKIIQTRKLLKFKKLFRFEFVQVRNCLENEKP
jgi:hypothetical protein